MKKIIILTIILQLCSCESHKYCSEIIRGKPDHLISSEELSVVKSLFESNHLSLDNFQVYRLQKDETGNRHVRCFQYVNDLIVLSDDVIFHFDSNNHYNFLSGEIIDNINIIPSPQMGRNEVVDLFMKSAGTDDFYNNDFNESENKCFSCELCYWDLNAGISFSDHDFTLAWKVKPEGRDFPFALINDTEKKLIYYDNGIRY